MCVCVHVFTCVCMCCRVCTCVHGPQLQWFRVHCQSSPILHNHLLLLASLLSQGYWNSNYFNLFSITDSRSINWSNWLCLRAIPLHGHTIPLSNTPCSVLVLCCIYVHTIPYICAIMFTWFNGRVPHDTLSAYGSSLGLNILHFKYLRFIQSNQACVHVCCLVQVLLELLVSQTILDRVPSLS